MKCNLHSHLHHPRLVANDPMTLCDMTADIRLVFKKMMILLNSRCILLSFSPQYQYQNQNQTCLLLYSDYYFKYLSEIQATSHSINQTLTAPPACIPFAIPPVAANDQSPYCQLCKSLHYTVEPF